MVCAWPEFYDTNSFNRAVKAKAGSEINKICISLTFLTTPFPTVVGKQMLVNEKEEAHPCLPSMNHGHTVHT